MSSFDKPVILVIDSDPLTMTAVAAALHLSGYEVHCARDREAATKAVIAQPFDLIICDVALENDSGISVYDSLCAIPDRNDIPVMFVSAHQSPDIIRRSNETGGVYYLRKPFDPNLLLDLVDKALWMPHLVRERMNQAQQMDNPVSSAPLPGIRMGRIPMPNIVTNQMTTQS